MLGFMPPCCLQLPAGTFVRPPPPFLRFSLADQFGASSAL